MTYQQFEKQVTLEDFDILFGTLAAVPMWKLYQSLGSIEALCSHNEYAKFRIDKAIAEKERGVM